uniref:Uncharacterized protein n=1 Tax=Romanomermis culicivorax TaxID=13658 RepID=A0A915HWW7_ROMCU
MTGTLSIVMTSQCCHWFQHIISLKARNRGCHLVTDEIVKTLQQEISQIKIGILHLCVQHTSASISLNENKLRLKHTCEGSDDMPAHAKAAFVGATLNIPITDGKLNLGTWQGIWLCEHRNSGGSRNIVATIQGAVKEK